VEEGSFDDTVIFNQSNTVSWLLEW